MRYLAAGFRVSLVVAVLAATGCLAVGDPPGNDNAPAECEPACDADEVCAVGECVPAVEREVQFGYTDEVTDVFTAYNDDGAMPYFTLGQGGSHTFVTVRATGIPTSEDGRLDITYNIIRQSDGFVLSDLQQRTTFYALDDGVLESKRRLLFVLDFPDVLDGVGVDFTVVVASPIDPAQFVTVTRNLVLDFVP